MKLISAPMVEATHPAPAPRRVGRTLGIVRGHGRVPMANLGAPPRARTGISRGHTRVARGRVQQPPADGWGGNRQCGPAFRPTTGEALHTVQERMSGILLRLPHARGAPSSAHVVNALSC